MGGLGTLGVLAGGGVLFTHRPEFGRLPQGERLARMEASPHYVNGQFQNLVPVQVIDRNILLYSPLSIIQLIDCDFKKIFWVL